MATFSPSPPPPKRAGMKEPREHFTVYQCPLRLRGCSNPKRLVAFYVFGIGLWDGLLRLPRLDASSLFFFRDCCTETQK
ncbi:hypothetical protein CEXT_644481 [Caerostris extrusa]|uniref:Uncharacterized protein n=1 Tax=Caerostris extrusa TaxID=172846 RepID=A0AAV4XGM2_CAEEX|nr:hypothetical protein CEXT_644481 [Caerostris extrusa]